MNYNNRAAFMNITSNLMAWSKNVAYSIQFHSFDTKIQAHIKTFINWSRKHTWREYVKVYLKYISIHSYFDQNRNTYYTPMA